MTQAPPPLRLVVQEQRAEYLGVTFDQWVEQNAERIWTLLRTGEHRDVTFNDLAERLWSAL